MNPLVGQDEHETLETLFRNVDLSFAEHVLRGCFHSQGSGRTPRSPLGLFRAFIVIRARGDIIVGDVSGVVAIPLERAKEVLEASKKRADSVAKVVEGLRAGKSFEEVRKAL